jgi:hypothetical protein
MMSQSEGMLIAEGDTCARLDQRFDNQGELKIVLPKEDSQLDALRRLPMPCERHSLRIPATLK